LDFLEVAVPADAIRETVRNNSLQQMRAKEDQRSRYKSAEEDGRHVRKGAVGGWREKLSAEQVAFFEQHAAEALVRLGYPLSSQASEVAMQPQSCRI
jgi:predicted phage gp36 major capsid-like protein